MSKVEIWERDWCRIDEKYIILIETQGEIAYPLPQKSEF